MTLPAGSAFIDFLPRLDKSFGQHLTGDITPHIKDSAEKAGDKFKAIFAGAAVAGGAALTKGLFDAIDMEAANDKLRVGLGVSAEMGAEFGEIAGNLYAGAWGDSLEQVNVALKPHGKTDYFLRTPHLVKSKRSLLGSSIWQRHLTRTLRR